MHDVTWIGSRFFTDTGGYYDTYRSSTPRDDWPYDSNRDAGLAQGQRWRLSVLQAVVGRWQQWPARTPAGAGRPKPAESPGGLGRFPEPSRGGRLGDPHHRLAAAAETEPGQRLYGLRRPDRQDPAEHRDAATGDVGMAVGAIAAFPAMDVVRQALPMVLGLLKMALVICIPLVLVVGTGDLKTVVTVSVVQFALFFVDFWFQLARWIDSTILDALYGWGFGWNRPHANFDPTGGAEQRLWRPVVELRYGDDVHRAAHLLDRCADLGRFRAGTIANSFSAWPRRDAGAAGGKGSWRNVKEVEVTTLGRGSVSHPWNP